MNKIVRGNSVEANQLTNGWVIGHMHEGLPFTTAFEVKMWHYDKQIDYGRKTFGGTEFIAIYGGKLHIETETETVILSGCQKEYVILPPNITKKIVVLEYPSFGVTVRWSSNPSINKMV